MVMLVILLPGALADADPEALVEDDDEPWEEQAVNVIAAVAASPHQHARIGLNRPSSW